MSNHVVTSLVPELLGRDALLNETVAEIERRALERRRAAVVGLSLKYRPVIKVKSDNCCVEDLPQVRQVQVLEGVQGLFRGSVRAGVGHGELTYPDRCYETSI